MKFKISALLVGLMMSAAVPAFAADNIATVNGKGIPASRLDALVKQYVANGAKDSPEMRKELTAGLIRNEVLTQESEKQGYTKHADVLEAIEADRKRIPVQAMLHDVAQKAPVTDAEIQAWYDRYKAQMGSTEYLISHIQVKTEDEAKAVIAKLKAGAKFEDLAKDSIDVASATNGGKLDWAVPANYAPTIADAMTKLQKGQYSDAPIQTPGGYHVLRMEDTRPVNLPPLDQLKPKIAENLQQAKISEYIDGLMKKAIIKQ